MKIVAGNTMVITCSISADNVNDYDLQLMRGSDIISHETPPPSGEVYEQKLSPKKEFKSGKITYTFSYSDMSKGPDVAEYKCIIGSKVTSLGLTPIIMGKMTYLVLENYLTMYYFFQLCIQISFSSTPDIISLSCLK